MNLSQRFTRPLRHGLFSAAALVAVASAGTATSAQEHNVATPDEFQFFPIQEGAPVDITVLWGDPENGPAGVMLRFPPAFTGGFHFHDQDYHAVVVRGVHQHWLEGEEPGDALVAGTYFFQPGGQVHADGNPGNEPSLLFIFLPDGLNTTFVE